MRMLPASRSSCTGHRLAVQVGARAPVGADHAAHDELRRRPRPTAPRATASAPAARCARSKVPDISARSAPWRTTSAPARPPASSCSASTRIDLPAPVSPVSTVSPGRSSSSTAVDDGEVADLQVRQHGAPSARSCRVPSEAWSAAACSSRARADAAASRARRPGAPPGDRSGAKPPSTAPSQVTCAWVSARSSSCHLDHRGGRDHDRAVREGVRADRRDHQHRRCGSMIGPPQERA